MRHGLQKMSSKRDGLVEILLGGIVLLAACSFLIYSIYAINLKRQLAGNFALYASFESVEGIDVGSDVLLAGVTVGTVSKIELDKKSFQANVKFLLFEDFNLPDDTEAVISSDGLLGGKHISLTVGGSDVNLVNGDELLYTQSSMSILNLLSKFASK